MKRILLAFIAGCGNSSPATIADALGSNGSDAGDARDSGVATPTYEIRISESQIGANGHTRRAVLVTGFGGDGLPLTDDMVVTLDRPSAGSLGAEYLTLGALGASTSFTPCDQATSGCLGPASLSVARSSDPGVALAHVDLELITPTQISTAAPCRGGGNMFYLDGTDALHWGLFQVDSASWNLEASLVNRIQLGALPLDPMQGDRGYDFEFETDFVNSIPFSVGTFTNVHGPSPQTVGPAMDPSLNGQACPDFTGAYQVIDVTLDLGHHVTSITLAFEKLCTSPAVWVEGCFHYGP